MAIKALTLQNFQAHRLTKLELSPTVTTIIGPTDRGKSAIMRALRWVALNDPSGKAFIRHGKKQASVSVFLGGSKAITRHRSRGGVNTYTLTRKGRKSGYKAFGAGVPDAVVKALKLHPINFQSQHDSPFWFSDTPGAVSRKLNMVINLSLIDRVQSDIGAKLRKAKTAVEVSRETLREAKAAKAELEYVPKMHAAYSAIEAKANGWKKLWTKVDELRRTIQQAREARKVLKKPAPDFMPVEEAYHNAVAVRLTREGMESFLVPLHKALHSRSLAKIALVRAEKTFHHNIKGKPCPLCHHVMR
jgi:exonuclease SbcC